MFQHPNDTFYISSSARFIRFVKITANWNKTSLQYFNVIKTLLKRNTKEWRVCIKYSSKIEIQWSTLIREELIENYLYDDDVFLSIAAFEAFEKRGSDVNRKRYVILNNYYLLCDNYYVTWQLKNCRTFSNLCQNIYTYIIEKSDIFLCENLSRFYRTP